MEKKEKVEAKGKDGNVVTTVDLKESKMHGLPLQFSIDQEMHDMFLDEGLLVQEYEFFNGKPVMIDALMLDGYFIPRKGNEMFGSKVISVKEYGSTEGFVRVIITLEKQGE